MSEAMVRAVLAAAAQGCLNGLDIGSGPGKYRFPGDWTTIDGFEVPPSDCHYAGDLRTILPVLPSKSYDVVYAFDVIEHLEIFEGHVLLTEMLRLARRTVLVFTPNGYMEQEGVNAWQRHRSGWLPTDFRERGFTVALTDFDYGKGDGMQVLAGLWAMRRFP